MNKSALFSDNRTYRYALFRTWDEALPVALCIGLNPSTADEGTDDQTINVLIKMLKAEGFGGLIMANLFALVSRDPKVLRAHPNPVGQNDEYLKFLKKDADTVIFCWGKFKVAEWRIKKVVPMFHGALCFGKTPDGRPFHPLAAAVWQKSKAKLQPY